MKDYSQLYLLLFLFVSFGSSAQTNIFPTSGNVGIGTISPNAKLDIRLGGWSNFPRVTFNQTSDHPSMRMYRPTGNGATAYPWWIENNKELSFKTGSHANVGSEIVYDVLTLLRNGNVGIGTTTPDAKLTVAGKVHAQEVKVTIDAGADFVFNTDYNLPKLEDVEHFIKEHKHLPEIASEKDMQNNGLLLAEMNIKLLQKIEELTLYVIEQDKEIARLKSKSLKVDKLDEELQKQKTARQILEDRLQKIETILKTLTK